MDLVAGRRFPVSRRRRGNPSRARLLALAHPSSRADLVAWLALLARGDDAAPRDIRFVRGDGTTRTVRATATIERAADGTAAAIAGTFSDIGAGAAAATRRRRPRTR